MIIIKVCYLFKKSYLKIYDKKLLRNYHKVSRKYQEKIFKLNY